MSSFSPVVIEPATAASLAGGPPTSVLVKSHGSSAGTAAPLMDGYYLIGRHAECQIRPKSKSVSRRHCLVEHRGGRMRLIDLDSTSGTTIDGRPVDPMVWVDVPDGSELRFGKVAFGVVLKDAPEVAAGALPPADGSGGGGPLREDDIADFLTAADEDARRERLSLIRGEPAVAAHAPNDETSAETIFDTVETSVPRAATPGPPPTPRSAGGGKKAKRVRVKRQFSMPGVSLGGEAWKAALAGVLLLAAAGVFLTQVRSAAGPPPRIVRGIE